MKYETLERIARAADVHPGPCLSRAERLERWAMLLERRPERRLRAIEGTEFGARREREARRADDSPLTVAFEDPRLRAEGLQGDRVGDGVAFFGLSHGEMHHLVCYCHYGLTISPPTVAARVRALAQRQPATLPARALALGGISLAGATALGLVVLAL
jgi:hypothetical protein